MRTIGIVPPGDYKQLWTPETGFIDVEQEDFRYVMQNVPFTTLFEVILNNDCADLCGSEIIIEEFRPTFHIKFFGFFPIEVKNLDFVYKAVNYLTFMIIGI